ncbi:ammonium transporter [Niveispirillum sp. BGYR6]|uniref:ammonium transporter n=1 Tax=Niveispirillum sp. BGYR6 TaxID=2971249 RepID=UPI0022B9B011|nr:ammonium transporter [Niveispirillum sp. BGYR6]MDG5496733.1 ammonium transporter [Niveispirillum sp. BGYR6]
MPGVALAQDAAPAPTPTLDSGNTAWLLVSTALVLFMTIPGLALFYGGMVRKPNVLTMMMQSFAICCVISVLWVVVGFSLAFGAGGPYIGDLSRAFLAGLEVGSLNGTIPESVFITFQMTFAIITPALFTGAFADRMKFSALLVFAVLWSLLVYSPVCHWVWQANGFLFGDGVLDYAGGTVVHINAGVAGLVACIILGKRKGYGTADMKPHNLVLSLIGASMLWVGWFGFNAGSAVAADGRAGMAMLVTQVAAATAALAWLFVEWGVKGKPSILGIISGAVAGLVAITPAAGFVGVDGALAIGLASGVICYFASTTIKHALKYDDSLDVWGVHGVGGIVGAVLTGVFAKSAIGGAAAAGALEGNIGQVWTQIYSVLITLVWSGVVSAIILYAIKFTIGLRVDEDAERDGLDIALHGESIQ